MASNIIRAKWHGWGVERTEGHALRGRADGRPDSQGADIEGAHEEGGDQVEVT